MNMTRGFQVLEQRLQDRNVVEGLERALAQLRLDAPRPVLRVYTREQLRAMEEPPNA